MRPATNIPVSGARVRGRVAPNVEPHYGIRDDCTITTGHCDCPPCQAAKKDGNLDAGKPDNGPHGIKTWRKR